MNRPPAGTDIVPLFLDAAETLRPPTPAVLVEHPERCLVDASAGLLSRLLAAAVSAACARAADRAEIRLELGSRPGCSFYLRDNGSGDGSGCEALAELLAGCGGRWWREAEAGWGECVSILLPPAAASIADALSTAAPAAAGSAD